MSYDFRSMERGMYGDFARNCEIIFSAPQTAFFFGEHAAIDGGISILQHINRYIFAGVKRTRTGEPRVRPIQCVPTLADRANAVPLGSSPELENLGGGQMEEIIAVAARQFGLRQNVEISLLSEGFLASGANTAGALGITVAACLLWASDLMDSQEFQEIPRLSPQRIALTKSDPSFQTALNHANAPMIQRFTFEQKICFLIDLGWIFYSFSRGGKVSGYGAVASLLHSRFPFIYFNERRSPHPGRAFGPLGPAGGDAARPFDLHGARSEGRPIGELFNAAAKNISQISYAAITFEQVLKSPQYVAKAQMPFTWGVVHSGVVKRSVEMFNDVERIPFQRKDKYLLTRELLEQVGAFGVIPEPRAAFSFLGKFSGEEVSLLRDPLRWEMIGLGAEAVPAMCKALEGRGVDELAGCMRRYQGLLEANALDWNEGRLISNAIYEAAGKELYPQTAVKLTGSGCSGCLLFIAPLEKGEGIRQALGGLRSSGLLRHLDVIAICDGAVPRLEFGEGLVPLDVKELRQKTHQKRRQERITVDGKVIPIPFGEFVSASAAIQKIGQMLPQMAVSPSVVLILGESGTGKKLLARAIHNLSPRAAKPLITLNCGALPDTLLESELFGYVRGAFTDARDDKAGRFAQAEGGTLFLDEIGDISSGMQVRLLHVIEDKYYQPLGAIRPVKADVRIIAATNSNLASLIREGRFRNDLYYRINRIEVCVPPLRERPEDILPLALHFIRQHRRSHRLKYVTTEALEALNKYAWPGNVRELENVIFKATLIPSNEEEVSLKDLPDHIRVPIAAPPRVSNALGAEPVMPLVQPEFSAEQYAATAPRQNKGSSSMDGSVLLMKQWAGDPLRQLLCLAFNYVGRDALMGRGRIHRLISEDKLFHRFAKQAGVSDDLWQGLGVRLPKGRLTRSLQGLLKAGWLFQHGAGRSALYSTGKNWPFE